MEIKIKCFRIFIIIIILILINNRSVDAHIPLETDLPGTREEPVFVEDHEISWVSYNKLTESKDVNYYRFEAEQGEEIYASMMIPILERLEDFTPDFALIGPGLRIDYDGISQRDVEEKLEIRKGEGVIISGYKEENSEIFREPFTQTSYWRRQQETITAPESGQYYLAVFSREDDTGKYVFAIGREEKWGIKDILSMPRIWWNVRMFTERELSTYSILALLAGVIIFLITRILK